MTEPTPPVYDYNEPFKPSEEQWQRANSLKRFNRLYVYTPVALFSIIVVVLVALMLIGVLAPGLTGMAEFASAMADVVLIMFMFPLIILMLTGPLLLFALLNNSRNRRKTGKPRFDQGGSFQVLLWKLDNLIQKSQAKTNEISPKMADQVIRFNELLAYTEALLKQIFSYFKRNN